MLSVPMKVVNQGLQAKVTAKSVKDMDIHFFHLTKKNELLA